MQTTSSTGGCDLWYDVYYTVGGVITVVVYHGSILSAKYEGDTQAISAWVWVSISPRIRFFPEHHFPWCRLFFSYGGYSLVIQSHGTARLRSSTVCRKTFTTFVFRITKSSGALSWATSIRAAILPPSSRMHVLLTFKSFWKMMERPGFVFW